MQIELSDLLSALCGKTSTPSQPTTRDLGQQIVVLDRGFVYVGEVKIDGDMCLISNARNIRYWGTTKGLGELRDGPLEGTKMDVTGEVVAPLRAVISFVKCKGF